MTDYDKPRASVVWQGDLMFEGAARSGFTVALDAEADVGGQDSGFRPLELMLVGLAGCTAMDVISILKKKREDVTAFEVRVYGQRAKEHPRVYTDIELEYLITGRNVNPKSVERAIELSETAYCPAQAMLRPCANIRSRYRIIEAEPA